LDCGARLANTISACRDCKELDEFLNDKYSNAAWALYFEQRLKKYRPPDPELHDIPSSWNAIEWAANYYNL
jgi:hypothetical protein